MYFHIWLYLNMCIRMTINIVLCWHICASLLLLNVYFIKCIFHRGKSLYYVYVFCHIHHSLKYVYHNDCFAPAREIYVYWYIVFILSYFSYYLRSTNISQAFKLYRHQKRVKFVKMTNMKKKYIFCFNCFLLVYCYFYV